MSQPASSYGFVWEKKYRARPMLISATSRVEQKGGFARKIINNNYWTFDYNISYYGRYKVGRYSKIWQDRPAHVGHLYPPRVPFAEDRRKAFRPCEDAWIIFKGGKQVGLDQLIPKGYLYARFLDPEGLCISLLKKTALIGKEEGNAGFWKAQAVLCELIGILLSSRYISKETYLIFSNDHKIKPSIWLTADREYLRTNCTHIIRLDDIARHFNVSVSTLCHRYHAETGESLIRKTRLKMRIELAKTLLLKGQRLKEISVDTGFCDPYHLSKVFKHVTGLSPRQFIASLR